MFEKESVYPVLLPKRRSRRLTAQSPCPGQPNAPQDREKHKLFFFEVENSILSLSGNSWCTGAQALLSCFQAKREGTKKYGKFCRSGQQKLHLAISHSAATEDMLQRQTVCQGRGSLTPSLACSSISYWTELFLLLNPCFINTHPEQQPYKAKHHCVTLHVNTPRVRKSQNPSGTPVNPAIKAGGAFLRICSIGKPKNLFLVVASENNLSYLRWDPRPS